MAERFKPGDKVEWTTSQGKTRGRVLGKQTKPTRIKGHKVAASAGEPQYIVKSDKSGKKASHKLRALKKR
jgi:Hypervirulence associated proteins TUDOR domain